MECQQRLPEIAEKKFQMLKTEILRYFYLIMLSLKYKLLIVRIKETILFWDSYYAKPDV